MDTVVGYEKSFTDGSRKSSGVALIALNLVYLASFLWMSWTLEFTAGQVINHRGVSDTLWALAIASTMLTTVLTLVYYPLVARWDKDPSEPTFRASDGVFFAVVCCVPLLILVIAYYL